MKSMIECAVFPTSLKQFKEYTIIPHPTNGVEGKFMQLYFTIYKHNKLKAKL